MSEEISDSRGDEKIYFFFDFYFYFLKNANSGLVAWQNTEAVYKEQQ